MRCDRCHCNEATILVDATVAGDSVSLHLCQDCVGIGTDGEALADPDLSVLLQSIAAKVLGMATLSLTREDKEEQADQPICPDCGLTLLEFRRRRRLGCETCYTIFADDIAAMLPQLHRGTTHRGLTPADAPPESDQDITREALLGQLSDAIAQEAFERAAVIRDALSSLAESSPDT